MKNLFSLATVICIAISISSCDTSQYRADAIGPFGEIIVITDSTQYEQTTEALYSTFGQYVFTIPDAPRMFDLQFRTIESNEQLERLKKHKNIIIAAPISGEGNVAEFIRALLGPNAEQQVRAGNEFAFILQNEWYDNQWVLVLTAPSDAALSNKLQQAGERLTESLLQKEFHRWQVQVFDRGEQFEIEEYLRENYGWKIRVKHDWDPHLDTVYTENGLVQHFFTMQRITSENDRRFWAWWVNKPVDVDTLSPEWIIEQRNQITRKWLRGSRGNAYVATETEDRPVLTDTLTIDGHIAYETLGTWRMVNAVMAGPFVNMVIYDAETERLFMLEFWQFAPSVDQRAYVRQWRAILRTFESDSTFSSRE